MPGTPEWHHPAAAPRPQPGETRAARSSHPPVVISCPMRQAIINNRHTAASPGPAAAAGGAGVAAWKINPFPTLAGRKNSIGERREPGGSACGAPANKRAETQQPLPAAATPSFPAAAAVGLGFASPSRCLSPAQLVSGSAAAAKWRSRGRGMRRGRWEVPGSGRGGAVGVGFVVAGAPLGHLAGSAGPRWLPGSSEHPAVTCKGCFLSTRVGAGHLRSPKIKVLGSICLHLVGRHAQTPRLTGSL